MAHYTLFLRGINLGNNHKVSMPLLRERLATLGLRNVKSYINTGNLFFDSGISYQLLVDKITGLLRDNYTFEIPFALFLSKAIIAEEEALPAWWGAENYRSDAPFYLPPTTKVMVGQWIETWELQREDYYLGETALFWRVPQKENYSQTSHARKIMTKPFNQIVTLRNVNTFRKIVALLKKETD